MQSISCETVSGACARRLIVAAAFLASFFAAPAWTAEPRVPYVPTPQEVVERMLETAKVGPSDYLIDLGSGDGRIVITAAKKHGARGFGVDLNPERVKEGNENARKAGVTGKVTFQQRDLFETDLSPATVITMYLLPRVNIDLRPKLLELVPGTRLVSHDFDMGDWKADTQVSVDVKDKYGGAPGTSEIFYWVVPARAAGTWQWQTTVAGKPQAYEVRLEQKYQVITGSVWLGARPVTVQGARLRGADIQFSFNADVNGSPVKHEFSGKIGGEAIVGTAILSGPRIQSQVEWNARRLARPAAGHAAPEPAAQTAHRSVPN